MTVQPDSEWAATIKPRIIAKLRSLADELEAGSATFDELTEEQERGANLSLVTAEITDANKLGFLLSWVAAAEREECAKICEQTGAYRDEIDMAYECAQNIRERSA